MTAEYLISECISRKECVGDDPCLYTRECGLFKDLYGCLPCKIKDLTEAERRVISAHVQFMFKKLSNAE